MKKLSQMSCTELSRVLCEIASPAEKLFADPDVMGFFDKMKDLRQEANGIPIVFLARLLTTMTPVFLGDKHRDDTLGILAALKGVPVEKLAEQNGIETMRDVWDMLMTDTDLMGFFRPRTGEAKSAD